VARKVLIQAALETPGVLKNPAPNAVVVSFDASSIGYRLGFWIDEPQKHGGIENTIRANMWYRLKQAGINIPYNIMTVEMADTQKRATLQESRGHAARLEAIRKNPLFSGLDESLQEMIASKTTDFHLAAGQVFFHQDDPADSMFILLEGTAELRIRTEDGREITAREMHAGDSFAEISAFTGNPRSGTISAKTDVRAMEITRQHLQDLFSQQPQLMANISERVAKLQQELAATLKAMGAAQPAHETHTHSQNVLERMRSFFSPRHR
jgi:CRP-like cAMP-binding protein